MYQRHPRPRGIDRSTLPWYAVPATALLLFSGFTDPDSTKVMTAPTTASSAAEAMPFFSGAFLGDDANRPDRIEKAMRAWERKTESRAALIKTFYRLDDDFSSTGWAGQVLRRIAKAGAANYVALDLRWRRGPEQDLLDALADGRADRELRRVARHIREVAGTVLLEPGWEMNGNWSYPWQGAAIGQDAPLRFVAAWRRLVDVFRAEGAHNVRFVFSPNVGNPVAHAQGEAHWNWYANYYPGDAWVDYVGAHGFNAPSVWGAPYQDFAALFDGASADRMLSDLAARYAKPIIIGEFASEEAPGRDKGEWIRAAYAFLLSHPRVVGAVWFDMAKEADWRIDSSDSALSAFREAMQGGRVRTEFDERLLEPALRLAST
jgi:endoglucanase